MQELMSQLSDSLFASEFDRHESALRYSLESAEAMLARHRTVLQHGMDISHIMSECEVLLQAFVEYLNFSVKPVSLNY